MVHAIVPAPPSTSSWCPRTPHPAPRFTAAATKAIQAGVAAHAAAISVSASEGEHLFTRAEVAAMHAALEQARDRHVTFGASAGDTGAISDDGPPRQVSQPASDPLCWRSAAPSWTRPSRPDHRAIWPGTGTDASGGGYSKLFPRPTYQDRMARIGATGGVPDVAANADRSTAMALEYSDGESGGHGHQRRHPAGAGLIALADQEAGGHLGFVNPSIYAIARSPAYHRAFRDVVTGDNSVLWPTGVYVGYSAGPGWDPVTGWGSPNAVYLVPLLAHAARSGA